MVIGRRRKVNGYGNGGDAAEVMAATVDDDSNGSGINNQQQGNHRITAIYKCRTTNIYPLYNRKVTAR